MDIEEIDEFASNRAENDFQRMSMAMLLAIADGHKEYSLTKDDIDGEEMIIVTGPGVPAPVDSLDQDPETPLNIVAETRDNSEQSECYVA